MAKKECNLMRNQEAKVNSEVGAKEHEISQATKNITVLIKGSGEKASAVAHRLHQYGFRKIIMTDLPTSLAERRGMAFCEALIDGQKEVRGVISRKAEPSIESINQLWAEGKIPVIADPENKILQMVRPDIFIDGVMAKRNTGTTMECAPLVIALGPGFAAGRDAHFVVETNPASPYLGRVISEGQAEEDTGIPVSVLALTTERLIRSPAEGDLFLLKGIGDEVTKGETIGYVDSSPVKANIPGCIWGIVRNSVWVRARQKIGDIDPRGKKELCFEIAAEAQTIADGALEGIITFQSR